jgi:pimeloyl-ACP methyl ester carboxylesterase
VPIAQAHALALAWPGTCRVVVVDDAAHFELIDPTSAAWVVVAAEVRGQALRLTRTTQP